MRLIMRIAMVVFGVSFGLGAYGMVKETISFQYGRELLLKDYQSNRFETGDWGNDIALMIPQVFNVKGKGWFVLRSTAEQTCSGVILWEIFGLGATEFKRDNDVCKSIGCLNVDPQNFYIVTDRLGNKRLCFYHFRDKRAAFHPKYEVWSYDVDWWELTAGEGRLENRHLFQGGIGSFFKEKDFKSIRLVEFHQYRGPKAEKVLSENGGGRWAQGRYDLLRPL